MIRHDYNRGVDRRTIFSDTNDYQRFHKGMIAFNDSETEGETRLSRIPFPKLAQKPLLRLIAYCLMSNHFHFLVEEVENDGISRFLSRLLDGYTKYFNRRQGRTGHLFEASFKSRVVQNEADLCNLTRYIHRNPLDLAGVMPESHEPVSDNSYRFLIRYPWSSLRTYTENEPDMAVNHGCMTGIFDEKSYRGFLTGNSIPDPLATLRVGEGGSGKGFGNPQGRTNGISTRLKTTTPENPGVESKP